MTDDDVRRNKADALLAHREAQIKRNHAKEVVHKMAAAITKLG